MPDFLPARGFRRRWVLGATLAFGMSVSCSAEDYFGRVTHVTSGDRLELKYAGHVKRIRVYGVDCPDGPRGEQARRFTVQMAEERGVHIQEMARNPEGRMVARVTFIGGANLSEELLRAGMARWAKEKVPHDKTLATLEAQARASRKGLWADPPPPVSHLAHARRHTHPTHSASDHRLVQR